MGKRFKKVLSAALAAAMLFGSAGAGAVDFGYGRIKASAAGFSDLSSKSDLPKKLLDAKRLEAVLKNDPVKRRLLNGRVPAFRGGGRVEPQALTAGASSLTFEIASLEDGDRIAIVTECNENASGALTIPSSYQGLPVTVINDGAFFGCDSLTSVTIPDSVLVIGNGAFSSCDRLTNISVAAGNQRYFSRNGVLFGNLGENGGVVILCQYPCGKTAKRYVIPEDVDLIQFQAFYGCLYLEDVTIPSSCYAQGYSISFESNFYRLLPAAPFFGCFSLKNISVDENDEYYYVQNGALFGYICDSDFEAAVEGLIQYPAGKPETRFDMPDSVNVIAMFAFGGCSNLESVTIPDSVTEIGQAAFLGCSALTDVYYGGSKSDWGNIEIYDYNDPLLDATIHYNSAPPSAGYTLTYDANGGTGAPARQTGSATYRISSVIPRRTGYKFLGWSTSRNGSAEFFAGDSVTLYANVTLYAVWSPEDPAPPVGKAKGDANGDGAVDAGDAVLILRYDAGLATLTSNQRAIGDVNSDGAVDAGDAVRILRYDAGLVSKL